MLNPNRQPGEGGVTYIQTDRLILRQWKDSDRSPSSGCPPIPGWWSFSWGKGFATEAALKILEIVFRDLGLDETVSFTAIRNSRSKRVMERIGMNADGEFDHPGLSASRHLKRHFLFRFSSKDWKSRAMRA